MNSYTRIAKSNRSVFTKHICHLILPLQHWRWLRADLRALRCFHLSIHFVLFCIALAMDSEYEAIKTIGRGLTVLTCRAVRNRTIKLLL